MKSNLKKFSNKIRMLREKRGLTQERLAELAGIDYKTVQYLEGKKPFNLKFTTIERLARGLNITLSELMEGI